MVDYELSSEVFGHDEDIRAVCFTSSGDIISASRDKTVKKWTNQGSSSQQSSGYSLEATFVGHTHFVMAVAWINNCKKFPNGAIVSGGMDKVALVWDCGSASILFTLTGHEEAITSIAVNSDGDIYTASQDKTVRIWRDGKCAKVLTGHLSAVQSVICLASGEIITGSSDCTIKVWKNEECVSTIKAHTDTVRSLAILEGFGFLSGSHDSTVKAWSMAGDQLLEFVGHTALVFAVAAQGATVASGSEDSTVRLFSNGEPKQVLPHPGCVWAVGFLPNGDLASGCSDGVLRVWTREPCRRAPAEQVAAYHSLIDSMGKEKSMGNVSVENLPGPEALQEPGARAGQTRVIREGQTAMAYSWNAEEFIWEQVGEVVGAPEQQGKTHNGQKYDHVFDVDIGDGVPARKLPYNMGEDPWQVARTWLANEELPLGYLDQVAKFIMQNTGQAETLPGGMHLDTSRVYDPYTGGQAYVPGGRPQQSPAAAAAPALESRSLKHLPMKGSLLFESGQFDGISKKLTEFSQGLQSSELALPPADLARLQSLLAALKLHSEGSTGTELPFTEADAASLARVLASWPREKLFPVLDTLRLLILHPRPAQAVLRHGLVLGALQRSSEAPAIAQNLLTGLRVAVNCFRDAGLREWSTGKCSQVLDLFSDSGSSPNKNVRLAWVTLLLNFAVVTADISDEEGKLQVLSAAFEMANLEYEEDVFFRALQAIGTLINRNADLKAIALDLDIKVVIKAAMASSSKRIAEVGQDLASLIA